MTPHGFGHATRTCALLEALGRLDALERVELFTTVPSWLFSDSLSRPFGYHRLACDLGLVQGDALTEDPEATADRLADWLPFPSRRIETLAARLIGLGCTGVICDVAPLGLAAARTAGLPSALVGNFTWSWIYRGYGDREPRLLDSADYFAELEALADRRILTEPVCDPGGGSSVAPVFRSSRLASSATRRALGLDDRERCVLWTMGGLPWDFGELEGMSLPPDVVLVVPGATSSETRGRGVIGLPRRSRFFHPDLVAAADGVIGKLGYSTVAEAWGFGTPMAYLPRPGFPEFPILAEFVRRHVGGFEIERAEPGPGLARAIERLLAVGTRSKERVSGADLAAEFLTGRGPGHPRFRTALGGGVPCPPEGGEGSRE